MSNVLARVRESSGWSVVGLLRKLVSGQSIMALFTLAVLVIGNLRFGLSVTAVGGVVGSVADGAFRGQPLEFWLVLFAVSVALEEAYWTAKNSVTYVLLDRAIYQMQKSVLTKAASVSMVQFENARFFARLERAWENMGERLIMTAFGVIDTLQLAVAMLGVALAMYLVAPLVPLVLVVGALPVAVIQLKTSSWVHRVVKAHTVRQQRAHHVERLLVERGSAAEVRVYGAAEYLLRRWRDLRGWRLGALVGMERRRSLIGAAGGMVAAAAYGVALAYVISRIGSGELGIGEYVTVAAGAAALEQQLSGLFISGKDVRENVVFLSDLFEFLEYSAPEEAGRRPGGSSRGKGLEGMGRKMGVRIELRGARFRYPGSDVDALRDVWLDVSSGERIAIVGENGAGKSTLAKVMLGLYPVNSGDVRYEYVGPAGAGEPWEDPPWGAAAVVLQDFPELRLTVRENVGFGDLERLNDDRGIEEALRASDARSMFGDVRYLERYVGREFGDTDLSGGQWQRLALARALFRDGEFVVLDEPSAALDPLAELALFERFTEMTAGRTAVMISHRLGMARLADRIVVLRGGEIIEVGAHDELIESGGIYSELFRAQAALYS